MITLDPHNGDLGTSSWTLCAICQHVQTLPGWFAICAHEAHYVDRATFKHYHEGCARALVACGQAQLRQAEAA